MEITVPGYRVLGVLGQGATATVYLAASEHLESFKVAIKVLNAAELLDGTAKRKFEREVQAIVDLEGVPNVVHLKSFGWLGDGRPFLVMRYIDGQSLDVIVRESGPLPVGQVVAITAVIARALEAARAKGVRHRDVKPENILISSDDEVFLVDFGIATSAAATLSVVSSMNLTMEHSAPERFGPPIIDPEIEAAGDVYSLGSTAYTMLLGDLPMGSPALVGLDPFVARVRSQPVPDLPHRHLPPELRGVLTSMMAKDWRDRPAIGEVAWSLRNLSVVLERDSVARDEVAPSSTLQALAPPALDPTGGAASLGTRTSGWWSSQAESVGEPVHEVEQPTHEPLVPARPVEVHSWPPPAPVHDVGALPWTPSGSVSGGGARDASGEVGALPWTPSGALRSASTPQHAAPPTVSQPKLFPASASPLLSSSSIVSAAATPVDPSLLFVGTSPRRMLPATTVPNPLQEQRQRTHEQVAEPSRPLHLRWALAISVTAVVLLVVALVIGGNRTGVSRTEDGETQLTAQDFARPSAAILSAGPGFVELSWEDPNELTTDGRIRSLYERGEAGYVWLVTVDGATEWVVNFARSTDGVFDEVQRIEKFGESSDPVFITDGVRYCFRMSIVVDPSVAEVDEVSSDEKCTS